MDNMDSKSGQINSEQDSVQKPTLEKQLIELQEENQSLSDLFEETIARANSLRMEVEIARLEFEQIFNSVGDPTWVINEKFFVVRINRAFLDLLGLKDKESAMSKKCYELMPSGSCQTPNCRMEQIRKRKKRLEIDEEREINKNKIIPFLITAMPLFGLSGELIGIVEQYKDMTERKRYELALEEANKELEKLAAVDGLTQLSNRRIFDERIKEEWRRMRRAKQPFSLILCDIDFFKAYNDYYGHQLGDDCLKAVADCIQNSIRRPGDLAARYGGEEFGVLLPNTSFEGAYHLAENIRLAVCGLKREHERSGVSDSVTLSLGVATLIPSEGNNSINQLLNLADKALYSSKRAGRNRVTGAVQ
jgi:diguanylate cyclase (GGDEF)-like protein/PAS domain S-box-containing protein